jgi:AcrR family transcriptional regulator
VSKHQTTAPDSPRRRAILDAALEVFVARGFESATIDDVRQRSGASVGSIYHHFGSKEGLAAILYAEGLADYQRGLLEALAPDPAPAEGIAAVVGHHLRWVEGHRDLARFLLVRLPTDVLSGVSDRVAEQNVAVADAVSAWLEPHRQAGRVRRVEPDLLLAILLGPSQQFVRVWLRDGGTTTSIDRAASVLSAAAVAALVLEEPA